MMNKTIMAFVVAALMAAGAYAQKQLKPWSEWNKKEAQKILDDSPWSQTQTESDTSEMFFTPTTQASNATRQSQGATNQAVNVNFRIRFFSARPIRQAFIRIIELNQSNLDKATLAGMEKFANIKAQDSIIVAVTVDGSDGRYVGRVKQSLDSAITSVLKNSTYLERKDGKRVFLSEYVPPGKDGFGARFIFPRTVDGQPFITADTGSIRFHAEQENKVALAAVPANSSIKAESEYKIKLDMRFKVGEMMYDGQLEY
jgi:hypothetical protein